MSRGLGPRNPPKDLEALFLRKIEQLLRGSRTAPRGAVRIGRQEESVLRHGKLPIRVMFLGLDGHRRSFTLLLTFSLLS